MKPLLSKITKPFLIYVLCVLVISIPVYYWVVDTIWKSELDEHNKIIAEKTAYELNQLQLTDQKLVESIQLWNSIQPGTDIQTIEKNDSLKDSIFTSEKQKSYTKEPNIDRFRSLSTVIYIHNKPFRFTVETNIEESQETIVVIAITTVFFFIIIVLGLLFINRKLSGSVWKPFRDTLEQLKKFNLNNQTKIEFDHTDTVEFEELNQSLSKLIEHNISVFKTQKEFTENASHELQTPLAILKNKLDILLQSEDLTEKQYRIAEEMNKALTRSSRINKNLLLLAKIENNQFDNSEVIRFDTILQQSMEAVQEHFEQKNISVQEDIISDVKVNGNSSLTEILIHNLILNAIRHTLPDGSISVKLNGKIFEVSNSGTEELNADLLFKRFSKLSSESGGSGLGLSIIQEICAFHGWRVSYRFENHHHVFSINL
ncbi:histidine kinase [Chryseobacterium shigense]|uniref:histidine kinase n=1 Tax=Chryseobacterium shigense TaxID=297244 RepID=A0A1N7IFV4_9FLAO|nr:HAMP domain-containing sensor histidine kinase [Chryseobacterium shigense]PQA94599.1 histidine kinase [Chryseobacterium shigense]SIS35967.1 Signal transduction histidine kinase [Chryseobacterium shigense]